MVMNIIKAILIIYSWAIVGILIVFLWRIAYFYEKTSGQRVGYYFLVIPTLLLVAGVAWYLVYNVDFIGQPTADTLLCSGGSLLGAFGIRLHALMTGERK
ncbi:MAG: hypothetical protein DRI48_00190 [Chloroflexi bacterium]|nr:MAG: hypothetical protein DRI48_00190 [Chloroflexota bacterium]